MPKCKGIINLYNKSKLKCDRYVADPMKFINDHINLQKKDNSYIYLFDGSKYLSVRNEHKNVIQRLDDPIEIAILWYQKGGEYDKIISDLNEINIRYFRSRYPIDSNKYKIFLNELNAEYMKTPHKYQLSAIINASITLIKTPIKSMNMGDIIAIIYYLLTSDLVGTMIAIRSTNNFEVL
jgi:hypothetical protein